MSTPEELWSALEDSLAEDPDDLATHMAYADLLAEQGDPRGEFIQTQLALEDPGRSPEERKRLQQRERELLDVLPVFGEARRHVGMLGIGVVRRARRQGLGRALLEAAIASAWAKGLTRIELTVRADNHNARELYERLGFQHEGRQYGSFQVDGETFDSHAMALLRQGPR